MKRKRDGIGWTKPCLSAPLLWLESEKIFIALANQGNVYMQFKNSIGERPNVCSNWKNLTTLCCLQPYRCLTIRVTNNDRDRVTNRLQSWLQFYALDWCRWQWFRTGCKETVQCLCIRFYSALSKTQINPWRDFLAFCNVLTGSSTILIV